MTTEILPPTEKQEIEKETSALVDWANALVVDSPAKYSEAAEFSKKCAAAVKAIHDKLDPICQATDVAHKQATKLRGDLLTVPTMARALADQKATKWHTEQEARRQKAEREAREAQQRKADEERLALAEKAEHIGDTESREALLGSIGNPPLNPFSEPSDLPFVPVVKGFSHVESYRAVLRPNGLKELVHAASRDDRLLCYLLPDMTVANRVAKAQGVAFNVPGFDAVQGHGTRVRG